MIALADLRSPAVAIDWHEAVAVVVELADLIAREHLPLVPGLDDVQLAEDGTLAIVRITAAGQPPAAALAADLATLLAATPCPAELRQLIDAAADGDVTLDQLRERLHFFERPGRATTLVALAARAGLALEQSRAAAEIARLTERARLQAGGLDAAPAPPRDVEPAAGFVRQYVLPAAVALTVFAAMAIATATFFPGKSREPPPVPVEDPDVREPGPPRRDESTAAPAPAGERSPATGAPPSAAPAAPPGSGSHLPATAPPASSTSSAERPGVDVRVNELGGTPLPGTPSSSPRPRASGPIYSTGDAGVTPPRLIRPHLPAEPPADVPPEQVGTLELLVDERGTVESVHLISPANRYQERMLVAAAKTWVFQPAMRDGRPVRFRARIRVTL